MFDNTLLNLSYKMNVTYITLYSPILFLFPFSVFNFNVSYVITICKKLFIIYFTKGAIATTLTQPLDVLKTRTMNAKPGEYKVIFFITFHNYCDVYFIMIQWVLIIFMRWRGQPFYSWKRKKKNRWENLNAHWILPDNGMFETSSFVKN